MTVAELIEEFKKQPQHRTILLATPSAFENGGGADVDHHYVDGVGGLSGRAGAFVVIEAAI